MDVANCRRLWRPRHNLSSILCAKCCRGIIYFVRLLRLWRGRHSLLQLAFSCMVLVYVFSVLLYLLGGYGVPAITWAVEYKSKIFVLLFVLSACLGYGGDAIASYS